MAHVGSIQQASRLQEYRRAALAEVVVRRRIELHTSDHVERLRTLRTDSTTVTLPTSSPDQEAALRTAYTHASAEQQAQLVDSSRQLAGALYDYAGGLDGAASGLQSTAAVATELFVATTGEQNLERVTTGVVSMALDGVNNDVRDLALSLQSTLDQQKSYREDIAEFRNTLADWPAGQATQHFEWVEFDESGRPHAMQGDLTQEQARAKMEELEQRKDTAGEDKQMWEMKLQDALQKQQQALQLLSSIMKSFHDTAKAIIQNLRA